MLRQTYFHTSILAFCIFFTLNAQLQAQDLFESLRQMREAYALNDDLHVQMKIRVYENATDATPYFTNEAIVKKKANNYFYRYAENEVLINDNLLLVIDREHKTIACQKRDVAGEQAFYPQPILEFDGLLQHYETPVYLGNKGGLDHYQLIQKQGEIAKINLVLDPQTLLVKQLDYHYKSGQWAVIEFTTFEVNPHFSSQTFSENQYLVRRDQQWEPSNSYKSYQVIQ